MTPAMTSLPRPSEDETDRIPVAPGLAGRKAGRNDGHDTGRNGGGNVGYGVGRDAGRDGRVCGQRRPEAVRAAVAVLPGRGESPELYDCLVDRLTLGGYAVSVVTDGGRRFGAVGEVRRPGLPFVLLGSDAGALSVLAMAGSPALRPDGLVLLGLPLLHEPVAGLPVEDPPPRVLPDLPILLIHGQEDQVSPLPLVRMTTRTAPRTQLCVVPGGHSVLTGPGAHAVPGRILLFLDELVGSWVEV